MQKLFLFLCVCASVKCQSQAIPSIFEESDLWSHKTWEQNLQQAKEEKKFIFLDFVATWCAPCKKMDKEVYSQEGVQSGLRNNFISVKIQVDTSVTDSDLTRERYATASILSKKYSVSSLPTFIFLTSDGVIVHEEIGGKDVEQFVQMTDDALNPGKQYYTQVNNYKTGKLNIVELPALARQAKLLGELNFSYQVAGNYKRTLIDTATQSHLFDRQTLLFYADFPKLLNLNDQVVKLSFHQSEKVDSIMFAGFSRGMVSSVIYDRIVFPILTVAEAKGTTPDWRKMKKKIIEYFGDEYYITSFLDYKLAYHRHKNDRDNYVSSLIELVNQDFKRFFKGREGALDLNNYAWTVFNNSSSHADLNKALLWIDHALSLVVSDSVKTGLYLDTKANILYRMGKKLTARALQEKATTLAPDVTAIKENLDKMRLNKPTWDGTY